MYEWIVAAAASGSVVGAFRVITLIVAIHGTPAEDRAKIIKALGRWRWPWKGD